MLKGRRRMILFIYSKNMVANSQHRHYFYTGKVFIWSKSIVSKLNRS